MKFDHVYEVKFGGEHVVHLFGGGMHNTFEKLNIKYPCLAQW